MSSTFDVQKIRADFPILSRRIRGKALVYFDNAATSQKPKCVVDAISRFYLEQNASVHRGIHFLSEEATAAYEGARQKIQQLIGAKEWKEIVFVRSATEGINLVAQSFVKPRLESGDEVLITEMEHHANIVPWQMICEEKGAKLRVVPITAVGEVNLEEYRKILSPKIKFFSVVHLSNVLGTINPVREMIALAHEKGIPVLVDGAQSVPHFPVDVRQLDGDFYVFSGHKLYGPTGIGVLYGKEKYLEEMPPYQGGGHMIQAVRFEKTLYNDIPYKFEAGTLHIAGVIGLGAAVDYVSEIGLDRISSYERDLLAYATQVLSKVGGLRIIGTADSKAAVLSFELENIHPHDIGTVLDQEGIAIRAGHHCAQPLMERLGVAATARVSLAFYNTKEEIDRLVKGLEGAKKLFSGCQREEKVDV